MAKKIPLAELSLFNNLMEGGVHMKLSYALLAGVFALSVGTQDFLKLEAARSQKRAVQKNANPRIAMTAMMLRKRAQTVIAMIAIAKQTVSAKTPVA